MSAIEQYWPLLALALWFGYKWWAAKQVAVSYTHLTLPTICSV